MQKIEKEIVPHQKIETITSNFQILTIKTDMEHTLQPVLHTKRNWNSSCTITLVYPPYY